VSVTTHSAEITTAPLQAQAYNGPAHGHRWQVDPHAAPPSVVDLPGDGDSPSRYQLVLRRRTCEPVRDYRGRYLYVLMTYPLWARQL
jgi:hypothetical protein